MGNAARKALKRRLRDPETPQLERELLALSARKPPKEGTPITERPSFWSRPKRKVVKDLVARGVEPSPEIAQVINENDARRRENVKATNGYSRNYGR